MSHYPSSLLYQSFPSLKIRISLVLLFFISCSNSDRFDIQGHRGAAGLFPENTIYGFLKTIRLGVTTLEMDVVITKDLKVIVSHEPWISSKKCFDKRGNDISDNILNENIFTMSYDEIQNYDCGSLFSQKKIIQNKKPLVKPLLSDVILNVEKNTNSNIRYNIEIKSDTKGDEIFHPKYDQFTDLVVSDIISKNIQERVILQSFDFRVLKYIQKKYPEFKLSMLVDKDYDYKNIFSDLNFYPDIYSPNYKSLKPEMVRKLKLKKIKIIPWTVNSNDDIAEVINMGVNGIISDYPDRVIRFLYGKEI